MTDALLADARPEEVEALAYRLLASRWASSFRQIVDEQGVLVPYSFRGRRYLLDLHDDPGPDIVSMKGTQVGESEALFNRALHVLEARQLDVLYCLPTEPDVRDLSAGRFAALLDASPRLRGMFADADNVHHKRVGTANLYLRGVQSESQLSSIPVSLAVLDEFDLMPPGVSELAAERLSGRTRGVLIRVSKPRLPGLGVDAAFHRSDRRRWLVPCAACGASRALRWPDSIELHDDPSAARWRCSACAVPWTEEEKRTAVDRGTWVPDRAQAPSGMAHGYHVPALLSPVKPAPYFALRWQEAQVSAEARASFTRAVLAEPYVEEGASVDETALEDAFRRFDSTPPFRAPVIVVGVDAGVNRHFAVVLAVLGEEARVLDCIVARDLLEVRGLALSHRALAIVIDANPNTEAARAALAVLGDEGVIGWLAFYPAQLKELATWHDEQGYVSIHRTRILDRVVARFLARRIALPPQAREHLGTHVRALRRETRPSRDGNLEATWTSAGDDHFAHALAYAEAAVLRVEFSGESAVPEGWAGDSDQFVGRADRKALAPREGWPQDRP